MKTFLGLWAIAFGAMASLVGMVVGSVALWDAGHYVLAVIPGLLLFSGVLSFIVFMESRE